MKINQLASKQNLELAWRRITTGGNYQYKRLYRPVYYAYEVALEQNLKDLRQRLLGGTFQARNPERIYVPKASGLHRPLALLNIEDQIVLQAFANLAAQHMQKQARGSSSKSSSATSWRSPTTSSSFGGGKTPTESSSGGSRSTTPTACGGLATSTWQLSTTRSRMSCCCGPSTRARPTPTSTGLRGV